jgi:hypothetical protein
VDAVLLRPRQTRAVGREVGLAEVNEAALPAKSRPEVSVLMTAGASCRCRKLRFGVCPGFLRRVVGCQAGGMRVIYEVLPGLLVLGSRRDRLPFGKAEQARVTDSGDG